MAVREGGEADGEGGEDWGVGLEGYWEDAVGCETLVYCGMSLPVPVIHYRTVSN